MISDVRYSKVEDKVMRKLASVQIINSIEPIENADRVEKAQVEGWTVVVPKGQFKSGDKAVYFEVDSFLPIRSVYEFLRKSCFKSSPILGDGFRLRTQEMRGVLSQGLCMPLEDLGITPATAVGTDLTETLGVREWQVPERATIGGTIKGTRPDCVPKTDETRYQTYPEWKSDFAGKEYYISTKMDGSSHSVAVDPNGFHVTGPNFEYKDDGKSSFYEFVNKNGIKEKVEQYYKDHVPMTIKKTLTIQGEYCGERIQKNRCHLKSPEWFVFTVIIDGERQSLDSMLSICSALGLKTVPIEEIGMDLPSKYPTDDALQERSNGEYENGGRQEGIVIRPTKPCYSDNLKTWLSMKVVNNKYLLKNE